ncbi:MAG: hypothetical protein ACREJ2_11130 [Planctomycetota bacterium]
MWALAFIGLGAGIAVGLSALGTGYAQAYIGAAAVGAMAEDKTMFGRGLVMTAVPETALVLGFAISFLLFMKLSDATMIGNLMKLTTAANPSTVVKAADMPKQ